MIRVFFNIRLDEATLPERRGQVVRDADEARAVARTIVRRLVQQHGGEPRLLDAAMVVTDEAGACLLDLSFFEALYVPVDAPDRPGAEPHRVEAAAGPRAARFAALAARLPPRLRAGADAFGRGVVGQAAFRAVAQGLASRAAGLARRWSALRDALPLGRRDPRAGYRLGFEPGR